MFSQKSLKYLFCGPCFYVTLEKFRLLDYVIVTCNSPGHDIKRSEKINILTVYYIIFNFLKSNFFLKVVFTHIPVDKDLEKVHI